MSQTIHVQLSSPFSSLKIPTLCRSHKTHCCLQPSSSSWQILFCFHSSSHSPWLPQHHFYTEPSLTMPMPGWLNSLFSYYFRPSCASPAKVGMHRTTPGCGFLLHKHLPLSDPLIPFFSVNVFAVFIKEMSQCRDGEMAR